MTIKYKILSKFYWLTIEVTSRGFCQKVGFLKVVCQYSELVKKHKTTGCDGTFRPANNVTRTEVGLYSTKSIK